MTDTPLASLPSLLCEIAAVRELEAALVDEPRYLQSASCLRRVAGTVPDVPQDTIDRLADAIVRVGSAKVVALSVRMMIDAGLDGPDYSDATAFIEWLIATAERATEAMAGEVSQASTPLH